MNELMVQEGHVTKRRWVTRSRVAIAASAAVLLGGAGIAVASIPHAGGLTGGGSMSMSIKSIPGEGTARGASDIDVLSYQWGSSRPTGANGLPTGKREHKPMVITKEVDQASPLLYAALDKGTALSTVTLFVDPPASTGDLPGDSEIIQLTNAIVTSVAVSVDDENPTESVSFAYQKIEIQYTVGATGKRVSYTSS